MDETRGDGGEGSFALPEQGVLVPFFKCKACDLISTRVSVIKKHQETRCVNAGFVRAKKWVVEKPASDQLPADQQPAATPTQHAAVSGHHNAVHQTVVNIVFPPNVITAGEERSEIIDYLKQNIDLLSRLLAPPHYTTMPARILHSTKGQAGPEALQNVRVKGNTVYTKVSDDHVAPQTMQKYARQIAAKMIEYAFQAAEDALAEQAEQSEQEAALLDSRLQVARRELCERTVTGKRRREFTKYSALELFDADNATFHAQVPAELKAFARATLEATHTFLAGLRGL